MGINLFKKNISFPRTSSDTSSTKLVDQMCISISKIFNLIALFHNHVLSVRKLDMSPVIIVPVDFDVLRIDWIGSHIFLCTRKYVYLYNIRIGAFKKYNLELASYAVRNSRLLAVDAAGKCMVYTLTNNNLLFIEEMSRGRALNYFKKIEPVNMWPGTSACRIYKIKNVCTSKFINPGNIKPGLNFANIINKYPVYRNGSLTVIHKKRCILVFKNLKWIGKIRVCAIKVLLFRRMFVFATKKSVFVCDFSQHDISQSVKCWNRYRMRNALLMEIKCGVVVFQKSSVYILSSDFNSEFNFDVNYGVKENSCAKGSKKIITVKLINGKLTKPKSGKSNPKKSNFKRDQKSYLKKILTTSNHLYTNETPQQTLTTLSITKSYQEIFQICLKFRLRITKHFTNYVKNEIEGIDDDWSIIKRIISISHKKEFKGVFRQLKNKATLFYELAIYAARYNRTLLSQSLILNEKSRVLVVKYLLWERDADFIQYFLRRRGSLPILFAFFNELKRMPADLVSRILPKHLIPEYIPFGKDNYHHTSLLCPDDLFYQRLAQNEVDHTLILKNKFNQRMAYFYKKFIPFQEGIYAKYRVRVTTVDEAFIFLLRNGDYQRLSTLKFLSMMSKTKYEELKRIYGRKITN